MAFPPYIPGIRFGTSFPSSPSAADLFYRTDTRILYEYNATVSRWLSLDRKYVPFTGTAVLTGAANPGVYGFVPIFEDVYIETIQTMTRSGATNDGSNFWTVTINALQPNLGGGAIASFTTAADAASAQTVHSSTIAAVYAAATYSSFDLVVAKSGTPSRIDIASELVLRSCG